MKLLSTIITALTVTNILGLTSLSWWLIAVLWVILASPLTTAIMIVVAAIRHDCIEEVQEALERLSEELFDKEDE